MKRSMGLPPDALADGGTSGLRSGWKDQWLRTSGANWLRPYGSSADAATAGAIARQPRQARKNCRNRRRMVGPGQAPGRDSRAGSYEAIITDRRNVCHAASPADASILARSPAFIALEWAALRCPAPWRGRWRALAPVS